MKLVRLHDVLTTLLNAGLRGDLYATGGGELAIQTTGQPSALIHQYLLKKGFIFHEDSYIYRP